MKKLITLFVVVPIIINAFAQSPQMMSYQCVVRDKDGVLVTKQLVGMRTTILQGSDIQHVVYQETYNFTATNDNGLLTIEIGSGKPTIASGPFSSIPWSAGPIFLQTEIDPTGGTNYTIVGKSQILSVPYALYAKETGNVTETDPVFNAQGMKLTGDQTISGHKTFTGNITVPEPLNPDDVATKAYVDAILSNLSATGAIDADGNIYSIVRLGSQVWMGENLKTTKFKDGTAIPLVTDNTVWSNLTAPGYCWYSNNSANKDTYGALYNWYTVNTGNLCPAGWHVPIDADWATLENFLIANGYNYDGTTTGNKIAKALASTALWTSSSITGAVGNTDYPAKRNATGFTALPSGIRDITGSFNWIGNVGYWWSATELDVTDAWYFRLQFDYDGVTRYYFFKVDGQSVRCLKD